MVLDGPAECGKTFAVLRLAHSLDEKVFVMDTQYGSASLYDGEKIDGKSWNFKHLTLTQYDMELYQQAISEADKQAADVIVIDSLSSAWDDCGGILEQVDGRRVSGTWMGNRQGRFRRGRKECCFISRLFEVS